MEVLSKEMNACNKSEPEPKPLQQREPRGFFSRRQRVMSGYIWRDTSRLCVGERKMITRLTFLKVLSLTRAKEMWMTWSRKSSLSGFIPSNTAVWQSTKMWTFTGGKKEKEKKKRMLVRLETIRPFAYSYGLPLRIIQIKDRWTFVIQTLQPILLAYQQTCAPVFPKSHLLKSGWKSLAL